MKPTCSSDQGGGLINDCLRQTDAERFCAPEIDDHFDRGLLIDRQLGRCGTGQNPTAIGADLVIQLRESTAVAHQTAGSDKTSSLEDGRNAVVGRQGAKVSTSAEKKFIVTDNEASCLRLSELSKGSGKVTPYARPGDFYLRTQFLSGGEDIVDLCVSG
jgi:hypothetical protein